ncbi:MAG: TIR domain-containing protein, partial [Anaerolineales bacterium]
MTSQIFISYSKKDKDFAWKLADDLVNAGHKVWIDRSLQVGEDWEQTIEKKLEGADEVIVILSSNSIASKWVQHEGSIAYGLKKQMYPVLIEELSVDELPLWMSKFQYHSFIDVDYEPAFEALNAILTPPNPIQDLLDQQVGAYQQTGNLMGAAILQVIEEARDTLRINEAAEELIEKSYHVIEANLKKELKQQKKLEKTRQQRTIVLAVGLIIALILGVSSFALYQESSRNLETSNRNLEEANTANTQVVAERNAAEIAQSEAETAKSEAEEQARRAQSGQLTSIALTKLGSDFDLAALLSVESIYKLDNFLSRDSLITAVQHNPKLLRSIQKYTNGFKSVAFNPECDSPTEACREILASGSGDGIIRMWDVKSGQQIGEALNGHAGSVESVAFSPDGKTLASGSGDSTIRLWSVESGEEIAILSGHEGSVNSVAFSPDGKTLASGSGDLTIRLWDVESRQQIGEVLSGHEISIESVAYSPDGKTLASGGFYSNVHLMDVSAMLNTGVVNEQKIGEALSGLDISIESVAFSPDGKTLASSGSLDGTIRLWDVESGEEIVVLSGHESSVHSVAFSPDGKIIASGSLDGTIRVWDVKSGQQIGEPLSGDKDSVWSVAFSPDGKALASGSGDDIIRLWDISAVLNTDVENGLQIAVLSGREERVESVAFSPDGKTLASGGLDNTIRLWDVESRQQIGEPLRRHDAAVYSVAFSPDGKALASGSGDGIIRMWDVESGEEIAVLSGYESSVHSVAFSPDGKTIASGDGSPLYNGSEELTVFVPGYNIRLWDVESRQQIGEPFTGHTDSAYSVVFSPDGKTLASGGLDNTIR